MKGEGNGACEQTHDWRYVMVPLYARAGAHERTTTTSAIAATMVLFCSMAIAL